jgi:hypothetical protein
MSLSAAPLPGEETAAGMTLRSPLDYQVAQRQTLERGSVILRGSIKPATGTVQARWTGKPPKGELPDGWSDVVHDSTGAFDIALALPAGGWYRLELRVIHEGKTIVEKTVEHVGIGEVFIVAGQSNSTNYGSQKQKPKSGMVATFDGRSWRIADDPQPGVQDGSTGGSFIPAFGDALYDKLGVPIGVASTGQGATSVRQWLPKGERMDKQPTIDAFIKPTGDGRWESTGQLYEGLIKRIEALADRRFRAVLWHQGESDAGQARSGYPKEKQITGEEYQRYMKTLIESSRKRIGWDVPWLVAQATYHSEKDASDDEFRAAQKALWESKLAEAGPDTDALRADYRDGVHFNGKGQEAHGKAWAGKVLIYLEKTAKQTDRQ